MLRSSDDEAAVMDSRAEQRAAREPGAAERAAGEQVTEEQASGEHAAEEYFTEPRRFRSLAEDDFCTQEAVEDAVRAVVAPMLRLSPTEQQQFASRAMLVRDGADEMIEHVGDVPAGMTFIVSGRVRVATPIGDGSHVPVTTLDAGSFLGQTALTRQPVVANAQAHGEVTAVQIGREYMEELLQHKPLLVQELGRLIEERRSNVKQAMAAVGE